MQLDQFKQTILLFTLLHEGGYANVVGDKGKRTYRGITEVSNPNWEGWPIINKLEPLKNGDIINHAELKEAVAKLYYEKYFKGNHFDEIESPKVALTLFDFAVNGGYSVQMVQMLISKNFSIRLISDGIIGIKTIAAINSIPPMNLCNEINKYRVARYHRIVEQDPTQDKFLEGWLSRVRKLNEYLKKI